MKALVIMGSWLLSFGYFTIAAHLPGTFKVMWIIGFIIFVCILLSSKRFES